jgi:hypothetical protein
MDSPSGLWTTVCPRTLSIKTPVHHSVGQTQLNEYPQTTINPEETWNLENKEISTWVTVEQTRETPTILGKVDSQLTLYSLPYRCW